ncbi:MAG: AraC family transcriptional regulator, partial [Halieaceae bacterium]|nr:AraC family transcriptional regulator [Halieaceae bacterium]
QADFELEGTGHDQVSLGAGCLVPTDCQHAFQGLGDNRMLVLDFNRDAIADSRIDTEMLDRLFDHPHYFHLDNQFGHFLSSMVAEMEQYGHDTHMQQHVSALLLHALYQRLIGQPLGSGGSGSRIDLKRLDRMIRERLASNLSVAELADCCHMSLSQFHLRFRQITGMTPYQYVMQHRLDQAVWLLQCASHSIADIAVETGFSSQSALTHAVKARYGVSPGQLRKQAQ